MSVNWTQFSAGIVCVLVGITAYIGSLDSVISYSLVGVASLAVIVDWVKHRHTS
jgi:hypothetical protein